MKIVFLAHRNSVQGKLILRYLIKENINIDALGLHGYGFPKRNFKNEYLLLKKRIRNYGLLELISRIIKIIIINVSDKVKLKLLGKTNGKSKNDSTDESILSIATKNKIEIITTYNHNDNKFVNRVKQIQPDLLVLCGANILGRELISIPKKGCINFHSSLLPKFRGVAPIFWQLWFNKQAGVTIHYINEQIDKGDIILQEEVEIKHGDDIESLHIRAIDIGKVLMAKSINLIKNDMVIRKSQLGLKSSYFKKPTKDEEKLLNQKLIKRWSKSKK